MTRLLLVALVLALVLPAAVFAAEPAGSHASNIQVKHADDPDAGSELPALSKYQTPGAIPYIGCGDPTSGAPCYNDPGGNGGGGSCSCSRICYEGHSGCNLSVSSNGCAAANYPALCSSCWNNCY